MVDQSGHSTSVSLLQRLRQPDPDAAWRQFVDLYAPLIFYWGRQHGMNATDASDLVQEVMTVLAEKLPEFAYDPSKRFRGWLRTITVNKARDFHRRQASRPSSGLDETIDHTPVASDVDLFDETEYRAFLVSRAKKLIESQFEPTTWEACWRHVTGDRAAEDVGRELGVSANAVRVAKCRVLRKLREELDGLLD